MNLIDEKNGVVVQLQFLDDLLDALFEVAAVTRAREQ